MWAGETDAFEAWTEGMEPEKVAFLRVMLYHQRSGASSCSGGCPVRLGTSFAEHQWDEFAKMRPDGEVARLRAVEANTRVHNHPPYEPPCAERRLLDGQLRGECLNDNGSAALAATEDQP